MACTKLSCLLLVWPRSLGARDVFFGAGAGKRLVAILGLQLSLDEWAGCMVAESARQPSSGTAGRSDAPRSRHGSCRRRAARCGSSRASGRGSVSRGRDRRQGAKLGCYPFAGRNQVGDESCIDFEHAFVLAQVAGVMALGQNAPHLGAQAERVGQQLKNNESVGRAVAMPAQRREA